jgi:c(7)-type cytochrome triheme protein
MRAAMIVLAILVAIASLARADFDHNLHKRDVAVSGREDIACTACHTIRNGALVGRPDHSSCFGSCHGTAPAKSKGAVVSADQARLCGNCHAPQTNAVMYPPYVATDFALAMPHKGHKDIACTTCHFTPGKPAPHRRCIGCHDGTKAPAMAKCESCHSPGSGLPLPPHMHAPIDTVTATFSHPRHAARGGLGAQCSTCHAGIAATDDSILPRPKQSDCAVSGCHDGKPTFSVNIACTRCHTAAPPGKFEVERPTDRYLHATTHKDVNLPCASCHPLGATGEVLVTGHAACVPCHEERFGERHRPSEPIDPKAPKQICGACHNATEPWRKLTADRPPPERTEFGATLSHDKHPGACASCHALTTSTTQLRPPRGHTSCTGPACHAVKGGAEPQLTACEGCHELGLIAKRTAVRTTLPWSTRALFDHAPHTSASCASCHDDLHADSILQLAAPKKPSCQPCHDGVKAFKLTGTTCKRCHPGTKPQL